VIYYGSYRHPLVAAAVQHAGELVHAWADCEDHAPIRALLNEKNGWPAVSLVEHVAYALLEERGFDIEALNTALSEADIRRWGDILGNWPDRGAPEGFWGDDDDQQENFTKSVDG
jgi:hypothetical protein